MAAFPNRLGRGPLLRPLRRLHAVRQKLHPLPDPKNFRIRLDRLQEEPVREHVRPRLDEVAEAYGKELLDAHQRVLTAARRSGVIYSIEPQLPPDVLGLYVYLPTLPS
jgi:hypothetical protein